MPRERKELSRNRDRGRMCRTERWGGVVSGVEVVVGSRVGEDRDLLCVDIVVVDIQVLHSIVGAAVGVAHNHSIGSKRRRVADYCSTWSRRGVDLFMSRILAKFFQNVLGGRGNSG